MRIGGVVVMVVMVPVIVVMVMIMVVVLVPMVMMVMMVPIPVIMMMMVVVIMMVVMMPRHLQPAQPGAERAAQLAILHVRPRRRRALPLDMVVMALLNRPHLGLEAQNGGAILAHHAGGRRGVAERRMPPPLLGRDLHDLLAFQRQNLRPVGARPAIGRRHGPHLLDHPLREVRWVDRHDGPVDDVVSALGREAGGEPRLLRRLAVGAAATRAAPRDRPGPPPRHDGAFA